VPGTKLVHYCLQNTSQVKPIPRGKSDEISISTRQTSTQGISIRHELCHLKNPSHLLLPTKIPKTGSFLTNNIKNVQKRRIYHIPIHPK
jgi:hypothetical protein